MKKGSDYAEQGYTPVEKDADDEEATGLVSATGGLAVTFEDLSYSLVKRSFRGRRCITLLQNVTGFFLPGQMLALMGPSGCGKTTLLDVLAGRKTQGQIEGTVLFGGRPPTKTFLRRHAGYVEQQDTLLGMLTVREMMLYTAELKLPREVPRKDKVRRVDELVATLGLNTCVNTRIGTQMARGISGGQARRVSIGVSLITRPQVLFLDEPTSGLDAATSDQIISCVRHLAVSDGVSVCSTIHTPTTYCFTQFDRLMLMIRGRLMYFGDNVGHVLEYFASVGFLARQGDSIAEAAIDIVTRIQEEDLIQKMASRFEESSVQKDNFHTLHQLKEKAGARDEAGGAEAGQQGSTKSKAIGWLKEARSDEGKATITPSWWALYIFMKFRTLRNYRSFAFIGPRLLDKLLFSSLMALLYHGQGSGAGIMQIINVSALNFMWVVIPAFAAGAYTPTISLDRALFYRERNDGLYRTSTYLLCKMIEELLIVVVYSIAVSALVFYTVQLRGSFLLFWLVYVSANAISVAFAYFVASASPNLDVANAAVPAFMMVMMFFAGFLIMINAIPAVLRWLCYIDFLKYGFGALQSNHWSNVNEKIIDVDRIAEAAGDKMAEFIGSLPDKYNLTFLQGSDPSIAPSPAEDMNLFQQTWNDIKQSAGDAVMGVTESVAEKIVEKTFGITINGTLSALNNTLIGAVTGIVNNISNNANGTLQMQLQTIADLEWGPTVLAVLNAGPPQNAWANWVVQSLFFFVFVVFAWLAMAFVQHQHR